MDQYFVVGPDGAEYGPTDLPGLMQWVREGRVLAQTLIRKGGAAPAERWSVGHRIRDVEVGPDGALWMLEDRNPGGLFRVTPK